MNATHQAFATSAANPSHVAAIGLTGQMHGTVLLDSAHQPLCPAVIWPDQRSAAQVTHLIQKIGTDQYPTIAGTLPAVGFMGPTLLWLQQNTNLLERTHAAIFPKDYIRMLLTGEIATDFSDAAGSGIFDITGKTWSQNIIRAANLPERIFPNLLESTALAGQLTTNAADALGLRAGIPVAAGCADQPAQALANGLIYPGKASITTGTGGQVFIPLQISENRTIPADPRLHIFNHATPDMAYVLGAMLSAGMALSWLRNIVGLAGQQNAYAILSAEAESAPAGADGLLFLPYLAGERTPHMDPYARGVFLGLSHHHQRGHLARAVMEGVAFALRQVLEIALHATEPVNTIIAAGGGAESDTWRGIQADVFNLPLQKSLLNEQTCTGAALLAGIVAGEYASLDEAAAATAKYGPVTEPNSANRARYDELYVRFLRLYPLLKDEMHGLQIRP